MCVYKENIIEYNEVGGVKISGICRLDAQVYVYAILLIANIVLINFISNHDFVTIFIIVRMYTSGDKTSIFIFRFVL